MGYHKIIHQIQHNAGISAVESEEAIGRLVEEVTERLEFDDRMKLARQLPSQLQEVVYATAAMPGDGDRYRDIFEEYMEKEDVTFDVAEEQLLTAWTVLKSIISGGIVRHFKDQLPYTTAQMLA